MDSFSLNVLFSQYSSLFYKKAAFIRGSRHIFSMQGKPRKQKNDIDIYNH